MDFKVIIILLLLPAICCALQGGVKIRVTKQGLDYLGGKLIDDLTKKLWSTAIPDQSGQKKKTTYSLTNIKLTHFVPPTLAYHGKAGHAFLMTLNGASIGLQADWRYKFKRGFIKISDHGSCKASASAVNIAVHAAMAIQNFKPSVRAENVGLSMGGFKVKVKGKMAWLYNLIINLFESKVKRAVEESIRNAIADSINNKAANGLNNFKHRVKVLKKLDLNYGFTEAPHFAVDFIEASLAGTFNPSDTNANVPSMILHSERMFMVAFSEETFNNFAKAAYAQDLLKYIYTDTETIKKLLPIPDNTTDPSLTYKLSVRAKEAPIFKINETQISCTLNARVLLEVMAGANITTLLDAHISIIPSFTISVSEDLIKFKVIAIPFTVTLVDNDLIMLDGPRLQQSINDILTWILPQINEEAEKGVKLPTLKRVTFTNGVIRLHQGYLDVATDFIIV